MNPDPHMNPLEQKIAAFALNPENQIQLAAFLKAGNDSKEDAMTIMGKTLLHVLLRFHGIPIKGDEAAKGNN